MPRHKSRPDTEVFEVVRQIVGSGGPEAVTFNAVSQAVGLSPATLVQRFGSKKGMLLATVRHWNADLTRHFDEATQEHGPVEGLIRLLSGWSADMGDRNGIANHLSFFLMDLKDADFRENAEDNSRNLRKQIGKALSDSVEVGELTRAPRHLSRLVQAVWSGATIQWALDGRGTVGRYVRRHLEQALEPYRTS